MDADKLVKMFKALANPNRLRLFDEIRLAEGREFAQGCSLRSIIDTLSIGAPTVSHHLKELVNAGLITTEKHGKFIHCSVNTDVVEQLQTYFESD